MIRPLTGLALCCFLVGCGSSATDNSKTTSEDATPDAAVAQNEVTASASAPAAKTTNNGTHTVVFKVPGMT